MSQNQYVEHYIIRIILIVGLMAASITTVVEWFIYKSIDFALLIDLLVVAALSLSLILIFKNKHSIAGTIGSFTLLILMTWEIVESEFLRQGSLAVIMVLGFSNSVVFKGKHRLLMHFFVFCSLVYAFYFLISNDHALPYGNSYLSMGINITVIYALLAFTSFYLKERYDKLISKLSQFNEVLEKQVQERTADLEEYKDGLEVLVEMRTKELQSTLDQLKKTQSQLIHNEKMASLGILSAGVAHEINNPLNFIKGGTLGLSDRLVDKNLLDEDLEAFIKAILEGTNRASFIVDSLASFSRHESSYDQKLNITKIVSNCIQLIKPTINADINLRSSFENDCFMVSGKEGALHQAIMNVMVNAIQSIKKAGEVIISLSKKEDAVSIAISDNGNGISRDDLPRVMDPFFTTKDPGEGTGIGLSITYQIIKDHHGTIEIESKVSKGTTVLITLPLSTP